MSSKNSVQKKPAASPKVARKQKKKSVDRSMPQEPKISVPKGATQQSMTLSPKFKFGNKSVRIEHRELCQTVTTNSSDDFVVAFALPLNPGQSTTFNWLSTQAIGWEQYKFHKLRFRYLTRVSTTNSGSVMLIPDYDAADSAPTSEFVASSYEDCREDVIWKDIVCVLDPKGLSGMYDRHFNRFGALDPNLDIKTYDVGRLFVAHIGTGSAPVQIGKLWVEYDVEFFKPQLPPSGVSDLYGGLVTGAVMSAGNPLGTGAAISANSAGISIDNASNLTIENPGTYAISSGVTGTGITGGLAQNLISGTASLVHNFGAVNAAQTFSDSTSTWNITGTPAVFNNAISGATTITQLLQTIARTPNGAL